MDENEQYSHREFYYPNEETKENAKFSQGEEPEAKQGSQEEIEGISNWSER